MDLWKTKLQQYHYNTKKQLWCLVMFYVAHKLSMCCYRLILVSSSLPSQSFGLDVEKFQHMTGDCPHEFLQTALCCCQVKVIN